MLRSQAAVKFVKRLSSSQVVAQESKEKIISTKLQNGMSVVTANTPGAHANVSIFVKAGSRIENSSTNLGISHCLRAAACLTTSENTAWTSTQLLGSLAGNLETTGSREHIAYNLKCGRKIWRDLITEAVAPTLCGNLFSFWELKDVSNAMKYQLVQARDDPVFLLMEAIHRASFQGGLAHSILSPESMIGAHTTEMANDFFTSNFTLDNMILAGTGVNHEELCDVGETAFPLASKGGSTAQPSKFVSSEVREHIMGNETYAGLSFCGSALNDQDAIAIAVLKNIMGSSSHIKRQSNRAGRLGGAIGKNVNEPFTISTYNINYSDAGVIGIYLKSDPNSVGTALTTVAKEASNMASGKISDKEVEAGKESLKASILMQSENSQSLVEDIAIQTSLLGGHAAPDDIAAKIDAITTAQISRVAKKVLGGKKSLAALGNLSHCPHLDDL